MADIADINLPVLPFRINWREGVTERLEWKTNIATGISGNEQRQSVRLTPRREFEVTLSLWDRDRSFWDLWLHRMVGTECLFPLWHDGVRTAQGAAQGQKTIWADTRDLEFRIGSYALLRGFSALFHERVRVAEIHDDRIVVVDNLVSPWPKGTRLEPLVRGRISDQTKVREINERVSETSLLLEATREQPYDLGVDSLQQFDGYPVFTVEPNRSSPVDREYQWAFKESDSEIGRRYRISDSGRAFTTQSHQWMLRGRSAKKAFRSFLYRVRGAAGAFWLPTFNADLELTTGFGSSVVYPHIDVHRCGLSFTGGLSSGRSALLMKSTLGNFPTLMTEIITYPEQPEMERVYMREGDPIPTIELHQMRRVSFMDMARFENDRIEFKHINAADGTSTVSSSFRTFRDDRVAPEIISAPIPAAVQNPALCGPDNPGEYDPCAVVLPDQLYLTMYCSPDVPPCNAGWDGNRQIFFPPQQPNPNGRVFSAAGTDENFFWEIATALDGGRPQTFFLFENFVPGDPVLRGQPLVRFKNTSFTTFQFDFYFPVQGAVKLGFFPAARFCSSVGLDEGKQTATKKIWIPDTPPINLGSKAVAGVMQTEWG